MSVDKCPECGGKLIRETRALKEIEAGGNPWPFMKEGDDRTVRMLRCEDCGRTENTIKNKGNSPVRKTWTELDIEKVKKVKKLKKEGKWNAKAKADLNKPEKKK